VRDATADEECFADRRAGFSEWDEKIEKIFQRFAVVEGIRSLVTT